MTSTRRHGEELEHALLEAAWAELVENGYATFTMDAVCARAGTSRPVLYRRWEDKHALVRAAVAHAAARNTIPIPDTGTLRGDTIALMESADSDRMQLFAVMMVHLSGYYQETDSETHSPSSYVDFDQGRSVCHRLFWIGKSSGLKK